METANHPQQAYMTVQDGEGGRQAGASNRVLSSPHSKGDGRCLRSRSETPWW